MTNQEINEAIAEHLGWESPNHPDCIASKRGTSFEHKVCGCHWWVKPNGDFGLPDQIPDYFNDLNAMHEAEKVLTKMGNLHWRAYASHLFDTVMEEKFNPEDSDSIIDSVLVVIDATAAQRAEAFLKTLNLWK